MTEKDLVSVDCLDSSEEADDDCCEERDDLTMVRNCRIETIQSTIA